MNSFRISPVSTALISHSSTFGERICSLFLSPFLRLTRLFLNFLRRSHLYLSLSFHLIQCNSPNSSEFGLYCRLKSMHWMLFIPSDLQYIQVIHFFFVSMCLHHCKLKPVNRLVVQAFHSLKDYCTNLSSFTTTSCHFQPERLWFSQGI